MSKRTPSRRTHLPGRLRKINREERARIRAELTDTMNRANGILPPFMIVPTGYEKQGQVRVVHLPDGWRKDKRGRYIDKNGIPL